MRAKYVVPGILALHEEQGRSMIGLIELKALKMVENAMLADWSMQEHAGSRPDPPRGPGKGAWQLLCQSIAAS